MEWMTLKELVEGTRKWDGLRNRRIRPVQRPERLTTMDLEKLVFSRGADINKPTGRSTPDFTPSHRKADADNHKSPRAIQNLTSSDVWLEDPELVENTVQEALEEELQFGRRFSMQRNFKDDPHHITQRYMLRIWARIFKQCPLIYRDETSKKWIVKWGYGMPASTDSSKLLPLFELVTARTVPNIPKEGSETGR